MLNQMNIPAQQVTTESHYFLVMAQASTKNQSKDYYTLVHRFMDKKGKVVVEML